MLQPLSAKQPKRVAWSLERLIRERAIALGHALEASTIAAYESHLQSYLSFCNNHRFPIEPTADTLSFYVVYMCHHVKPSTVGTYLSGICNLLEPYFPNVRESRSSPMVCRSLAGMKKLRGLQPANRKRALTKEDLSSIIKQLDCNPSYDDRLFAAMLLTGFFGLLRLGELTVPDNLRKRSFKKVIMRHTLSTETARFTFILPYHKADRFYAGNTVIIEALPGSPINPFHHMCQYVAMRDASFPLLPALWITAQGQPPTYSWFVSRLQKLIGNDVAGHSLRSGGATALALAGVADNAIQAMGRWSSDTWRIYIRKHPVLLQAMMHGHSTFQTPSFNTSLSAHPISSRE
ncbi:hypothetical protein M422DRAFT_194441 [Sphaerobolus stellatus SS14]|uniref:Uncharacterized protein n=1 Tax=Sphaerobolus stellatus (strain SS14) TaxID=990650 RepID=A0A0C9TRW6_SPHS4|nr:hypothetical protein M422DRAFT_194441 [Sphaerobolus stellatus SS14]